jgi:hypothetical protein
MSNIRIDSQKALKKWSPVLENMGVTNEDRLNWMSEYAEYHTINENAYVNAANAGMGGVYSPQPSFLAGYNQQTGAAGTGAYNTLTGNFGSGDLGQNLLPVAMKIAAQTIGLDLVSVKPTPGPKLDLLYIDFQYDDVDVNQGRPQIFKYSDTQLTSYAAAIRAFLLQEGITENSGGLNFQSTNPVSTNSFKKVYINVGANQGNITTTAPTAGSYQRWVEFLGFSRIDGHIIFKAFRQNNAVGNMLNSPYPAPTAYSAGYNTFGETASLAEQILALPFTVGSYGTLSGGATATTANTTKEVNLVSALEDHIPGFSTNFQDNSRNGQYPMSRAEDDLTYAGVIGPKVSTKAIAVGTIEVSSVLRRTEIEDIKANTGMDIVQKMESILVNELSQVISKQIVGKIFEMGDLNRSGAPLVGTTFSSSIVNQTVFDLDTAYATSVNGPGGETTHAIQRKLITKMVHASNYIATEGRVGPAQYAVTNGALAASLMDIAGYTINPTKSKINGSGQLYPVGQIGDIQVYVDPYMKYNDNRIVLGRKNNPDQPGIIFVPYLMAQSISLISEATFAPRMLLRSRYAVAEVGWFPQKQYMTIKVVDNGNFLN